MVGPGRCAEPDRGAGPGGGDQLRPETQGAAAAGRLNADEPPGEVLGRAEHDRPEQVNEALIALGAEIRLGSLRAEQDTLGRLHHRHDGGFPVLVPVGADAEIELARTRVVAEKADEGEQ